MTNDDRHFGIVRRKGRAFVKNYGRPVAGGVSRKQAEYRAASYNDPNMKLLRACTAAVLRARGVRMVEEIIHPSPLLALLNRNRIDE